MEYGVNCPFKGLMSNQTYHVIITEICFFQIKQIAECTI